MSNESLSRKHMERALSTIVDRLKLRETVGEAGGPLVPLTSQFGPVGALRCFTGSPLHQVVTISIAVPPIGLDSHMLFAFAPADSAVPHFTIDSVHTGQFFAFHLDLIPRVDLGENLAYIDEAFAPLTEANEAAKAIPGTEPAHLKLRQLALMSPWLLAFRADEEAFKKLAGPTDAYLSHWLKLVDKGMGPKAMENVDRGHLAVRDQRNKDFIFDPQVDPVWSQVARLVGEPVATELRRILRRAA
jgi:hypothetical protein